MRRRPGIRERSSSSCSPPSSRHRVPAACPDTSSARWRSSAASRSGASSRSRGPTRRGKPGTAPTGRCSSSPSTRCSRCFPGGPGMLRWCSGRSRPGRRRSAVGSSWPGPRPASAKADSQTPPATRMPTERSSSPRSGRPLCWLRDAGRRGPPVVSCSPPLECCYSSECSPRVAARCRPSRSRSCSTSRWYRIERGRC